MKGKLVKCLHSHSIYRLPHISLSLPSYLSSCSLYLSLNSLSLITLSPSLSFSLLLPIYRTVSRSPYLSSCSFYLSHSLFLSTLSSSLSFLLTLSLPLYASHSLSLIIMSLSLPLFWPPNFLY